MEVVVNGRSLRVDGDRISLDALLKQEGFTGTGLAVAVNNRVVPRQEWGSYELSDGMRMTIIRAVCGG
ncbi:MAG: sulfur carrier protein ThiS [Muribaculaceae bacterium]|nr:sulfur carrier protein ThiS [Muribaculaceae bacterium]